MELNMIGSTKVITHTKYYANHAFYLKLNKKMTIDES